MSESVLITNIREITSFKVDKPYYIVSSKNCKHLKQYSATHALINHQGDRLIQKTMISFLCYSTTRDYMECVVARAEKHPKFGLQMTKKVGSRCGISA